MSSCVGLVYFRSLVGLRVLLVVYLGVNGEKKVNGNRDSIKMDIAHSHWHNWKF